MPYRLSRTELTMGDTGRTWRRRVLQWLIAAVTVVPVSAYSVEPPSQTTASATGGRLAQRSDAGSLELRRKAAATMNRTLRRIDDAMARGVNASEFRLYVMETRKTIDLYVTVESEFKDTKIVLNSDLKSLGRKLQVISDLWESDNKRLGEPICGEKEPRLFLATSQLLRTVFSSASSDMIEDSGDQICIRGDYVVRLGIRAAREQIQEIRARLAAM